MNFSLWTTSVIWLWLVCSCKISLFESNDQHESKQTLKSSGQRPSEETEGMPGYGLVCEVVKTPDESNENAQMGCFIVNAIDESTKVSLEREEITVVWGYQLDNFPTIQVSFITLESGPYHSIFTISGGQPEQVFTALKALAVTVRITNKQGNQSQDLLLPLDDKFPLTYQRILIYVSGRWCAQRDSLNVAVPDFQECPNEASHDNSFGQNPVTVIRVNGQWCVKGDGNTAGSALESLPGCGGNAIADPYP